MRISPRPAPRRPTRAIPQIRHVQRVFPTLPRLVDFYLTDRRPAPPRRSFTEGTRRRGSPVRRPRPRGQGRGGGGRTTRGDGVPHVRRRRRVECSRGGGGGVAVVARRFGSIRRVHSWRFERAEDVARVSAIVLQRVAGGAAGARAPGEVLGPRLRGGGARAGGSVDGFHRGGFGGVGGG